MENTVLILGAGFSIPYGYPSGADLVQQLISKHRSAQGHPGSFSRDLEDWGSYSIDRFLYENPQYSEFGVQQIVETIAAHEESSITRQPSSSEDIIKLVMNEISEESFPKIKIITFNYDRLLEWKILKKLFIRHKGNLKSAVESFNKLEIHHVHGRMPLLRNQEVDEDSKDFHYSYGIQSRDVDHRKWISDSLREHAKSIKTIYTNTEPSHVAVNAIKWARRIFFIGFGYDELNMKKLGFNVPGINYDFASKLLAGTGFNLPEVEMRKITYLNPFLEDMIHPLNGHDFFRQKFHLTNYNFDVNSTAGKYQRSCCLMHATQEIEHFNYESFGETLTRQPIDCPYCNQRKLIEYVKPAGKNKWIARSQIGT